MAALDEGCSPWGLKGSRNSFFVRILRMTRRTMWRWRCCRSVSKYRGSYGEFEIFNGLKLPVRSSWKPVASLEAFGRVFLNKGKGVWMPGKTPKSCDNESEVGSDPNGDCPVCLERTFLVPRSCGHRFCLDCRAAWRESSLLCPLCRRVDDGIRLPHPAGDVPLRSGCPCRGPLCVCDL